MLIKNLKRPRTMVALNEPVVTQSPPDTTLQLTPMFQPEDTIAERDLYKVVFANQKKQFTSKDKYIS